MKAVRWCSYAVSWLLRVAPFFDDRGNHRIWTHRALAFVALLLLASCRHRVETWPATGSDGTEYICHRSADGPVCVPVAK